jgi:hypothetical protein
MQLLTIQIHSSTFNFKWLNFHTEIMIVWFSYCNSK